MTTPDPKIIKTVERLDYRVTVGDVAAQAGLNVNLAQQGLLALASEAGGHLQVAESGEVVYLFPPDLRAILRNKSLRLRLQAGWEKIWRILFYLIRISFGIVLIASIGLIAIALILLTLAASAAQGDDSSDSGGDFSIPNIGFSPDFFWIFYPDYGTHRDEPLSRKRSKKTGDREERQMNFLEAVFSFLFGDGNPNLDLETRRWRAIGAVIRNNQGAVIAEQIAPYLDSVGQGFDKDYEAYMLPVLTRFNGRPEVSPDGGLVYHFPDLQTSAIQQRFQAVQAYLQEFPWRFSQASAGQLILAAGLGGINLVGALVLGKLLAGGAVAGGFLLFIQSIYWLLLGYGAAFLAIPLLRYFWIQGRNRKISTRNEDRRSRALSLNQADVPLQAKLTYAQQFAASTVISSDDLAYTTEQDLLEQEAAQTEKIDAEWQQRLNEGSR